MKNETPGMTPQEKQDLKERIIRSIGAYRRRRVLMYTAVAASITFLAGSLYIWTVSSSGDVPDAYRLAAAIDIRNHKDVVLQLSGSEQVVIPDDSAVIEYSSDNQAIKIGDSRTIKNEGNGEKELNSLIVPYGKRTEIILSDGTKVWLNSGSKLVYPSSFSGGSREVFLIGEAIFDVTENERQPFYVSTNDYKIKVLGTVFNVTNYPDDAFTSTVLKSGLIQINYKEKGSFGFATSVDITPGTKATFQRGKQTLETSVVDVDTYFSWRDGFLIFKKHPLEHIMKKVSRYYNIEVNIASQELKEERFTGHLNLKDDIFQVIDIINESAGLILSVEKVNDENIIILKNK